jgi:hypothetical protein
MCLAHQARMQQPVKMTVSRTACVISLVALVAAVLALADISHGESDVTLEWHVVQASFAIMLVFHILMLRLLRQRGGNGSTAAPDIR